MQHRLLLATAFLYLTVSNIVWAAWDTRPPFWDLALHQTGALHILNAISERGAIGLTAIPYATGFYPPLFHSVLALFYAFFGISTDTVPLANLPATAILMGATYRIGSRLVSPMGGAVSAILVTFYPLMIWLSREALVDYWLTAMVALAFAVLLETDGFKNRRMTIAFGLVCGLGMLTKWTFAVFLLMPALWFAWRRIEGAILAAAVAAGVASLWYVPRLDILGDFLALNTAGGVAEGDPTRLSWGAIVFYVRALAGYQIFLPLFLVFLIGLVWTIRNFRMPWAPVLLWIAGSWAGLLVFQNKDPRYSVGILPAVAVISAGAIVSLWARSRTFAPGPRRQWVLLVLGGFLLVQHYMVSFGIGALPRDVVLSRGVDSALHRDWALYSQHYLDLLGPPAQEDWRIDHVLDHVTSTGTREPVRLGIIPDIPRFDWLAFEFYILVREDAVRVERLTGPDPLLIHGNDYILLSERAQGYGSGNFPGAIAVNQYIFERPAEFEVVDRFDLPNGESIRLYRVRTPSDSIAN